MAKIPSKLIPYMIFTFILTILLFMLEKNNNKIGPKNDPCRIPLSLKVKKKLEFVIRMEFPLHFLLTYCFLITIS